MCSVMGYPTKDMVLQETFSQAAPFTCRSRCGVKQPGENDKGAISEGERPLRGSSLFHHQFSGS